VIVCRLLFAAAIAALLGACQATSSDHTYLRSETTDDSYRSQSIVLTGTGRIVSSATIPTYFRVFEHEGKVAICGAYALPIFPSCPVVLARAWFDESTFQVNQTRIGTGTFFERNAPKPGNGPYSAQCVVTREPWNDALAGALRLGYRGAAVRTMCHYGT
jgi:hypothetical protein